MHKIKISIITLILALVLVPANKAAAAPPQLLPEQSPSAVIAGINNYRAGNGLYSYTYNSTLAAIAQGQADYQASIGTVTHDGPGGTRPINRAYNANYGNGKKIFVSEIIYGGTQATTAIALEWWKNSAIHNEQMLASTYVQIGAGVATNGEATYYVAVMGWVTGISAPGATTAPSTGNTNNTDNNNENNGNDETAIIIPAVPVIEATPKADGSVIHIIRSGQALWTVSVIYGVPLETILELNELSESAWVRPGDEILVKPPYTPTPIMTATLTASPTPVPSSTPTNTPVAIAENPPSDESNTATEDGELFANDAIAAASTGNQNARWIVLLSFAMLMIVIVGSMFMQKPPERPEQNDDVVR